jgi:hypothetical protein
MMRTDTDTPSLGRREDAAPADAFESNVQDQTDGHETPALA